MSQPPLVLAWARWNQAWRRALRAEGIEVLPFREAPASEKLRSTNPYLPELREAQKEFESLLRASREGEKK